MQSVFYAIFEGFESFYKMAGAYRNFSERLGGLILERVAYTRNFSVVKTGTFSDVKISRGSTVEQKLRDFKRVDRVHTYYHIFLNSNNHELRVE